jgi:hypothetical protein
MGTGPIFLKTSIPLSLIKSFRMRPLLDPSRWTVPLRAKMFFLHPFIPLRRCWYQPIFPMYFRSPKYNKSIFARFVKSGVCAKGKVK